MYLHPKGNVDSSAAALITRSRAPVLDPVHLHQLYGAVPLEHALVAVSVEQAALLVRYPSELAASDLTIVTNVPGLVYRSDWMMATAALPRVDWMEMEGRLAKSGLTAYTPEQLAATTSSAPSILPLDLDEGIADDPTSI